MWKVNHCPDTVTERDILPMEMLEWKQLVEQRAAIEYKLHYCRFTPWMMDCWKRGMTPDQLYELYNKDHTNVS